MVSVHEFTSAWADKPNRDKAIAIAEKYIAENAATLDPILGGKTSDDCVNLVSLSRAAGNDDMATVVTMWELVKFPRKHIGGAVVMGKG